MIARNGVQAYEKLRTEQDVQLELLQKENAKLTSTIRAITESNTFLEDCIVEIASIVYA